MANLNLSAAMWRARTGAATTLARTAGLAELFEADTSPLFGGDLASRLRRSAPAVLDLGDRGVFAILSVRRGRATLLAPDLRTQRVSIDELVDLVIEPHTAGVTLPTGVPAKVESRVRRVILSERLHNTRLGSLTLLSRPPGTNFVRQLREAGLLGTLAGFTAAHLVETILWLAVWWAAGRAALSGLVDSGLMLGCGLPPRTRWFRLRILGGVVRRRKFSVGASGATQASACLAGALRASKGRTESLDRRGRGQVLQPRDRSRTRSKLLALLGGLMVGPFVRCTNTRSPRACCGSGAGGGTPRCCIVFLGFVLTFGSPSPGAVLLVALCAATARDGRTRELALTHDAVEANGPAHSHPARAGTGRAPARLPKTMRARKRINSAFDREWTACGRCASRRGFAHRLVARQQLRSPAACVFFLGGGKRQPRRPSLLGGILLRGGRRWLPECRPG
jgi:hypothetical protein